jgi:hypothetical protein
MMKNWIQNNLLSNGKLISKKCLVTWFEKTGQLNVYNDVLQSTSYLNNPTFPQRIWHIVNDITIQPICKNPNCKNVTTFTTFTKGYLRTCSPSCAQLDEQTVSKIKSTNIKKYGCEYGLSNKDIIDKKKKTCVKNYGVDNPTKSDEVLNRIKSTNLSKFGVEWILSDQVKKENAVFDKYGVKNIQQSEEVKNKTTKSRRSNFYDSLLTTDRLRSKVDVLFTKEEYIECGYYTSFKFRCKTCSTEFLDCLEDGDVPVCPTCNKLSSTFQTEVYDFIVSLNVTPVEKNVRTIINPLEIDLYLSEKKLAIECNGLYWHGEINGNKSKNYHLNKTQLCEKKGIRLIHIFEDEWRFKKDIVKSRIRSILSVTTNTIFARKCEIREVDVKTSTNFLTCNHLQGKDNSSIKLGLYHNNELVSLMTFGKLRTALGNKSIIDTYELYRFCSKLDTSVTGGASKLIKYFIKNYNPSKIISYADRRWSVGNLYTSIGFIKKSNGVPNYWYFGKGNSYKRYHRYGYAKHTLSNKIEIFDPNLTEWENMRINKWDRIWDCGSLKFELFIK